MKRSLYMIIAALFAFSSCGVYSFSGTSIAPDVTSISVARIENRAMRVNPALSNQLTESLKEKYRKLTKLSIEDMNADLEVEGEITNYEITSMAVTANEVASMNRLTITVKIRFTNKKYPKEDFDRSFAEFEDYSSSTSLDAVEARLVDAITEKLTESIFNATVANW
ncbi:MAG: LPS assembly lipoprotein LptE [Bacteroidales bacterium]|nr:LPS assembly lipoprotein LptE [Bacteroidales bacterium]MDD4058583.1 LPS assembly lipoprotein LptE [Bacteroidales bacterium]